MLKRFILLCLYLILSKFYGNSQSNIPIFRLPKIYDQNNQGKSLPPKSQSDVSDRQWIVFADKSKVISYENPSTTSAQKKTLNFLDPFFVVDENGSFLRLYKYDFTLLNEGKKNKFTIKSANAQDCGWVKKTDLLLWYSCLETNRFLSKKALPILNRESMKKAVQSPEGNFPLFEDASLSIKSKNFCNTFQILYVFKEDEENNSVLLGISNSVLADNAKDKILGWINKEFIQEWNDRICLEPNWDDDAVAERKSKGYNSSIFKSEEEVVRWKQGDKKVKPIWFNDPFDKRWIASQKRLPIFGYSGANKEIVKTGKVTGIIDANGEEKLSAEKYAGVAQTKNNLNEKKRQFNVVFVVDGSTDMKPYLNSVKEIISKTYKRNKEEKGDNNDGSITNQYSYGCVIYRGMDDNKNCPSIRTDLIATTTGLSSQSFDVIDWIDKESEKSICDKVTGNKKVVEGIESGLRLFKDKNQTNILILIGGAKTEKDDINGNGRLIKSLNENNVNFLVFQVTNKPFLTAPSYNTFFTSFKSMLEIFGQKEMAEVSTKTKEKDRSNFDPKKVFEQADETGNTFNLNYPEQSSVMGLMSSTDIGSIMRDEYVAQKISKLIDYKENEIDKIIKQSNSEIEAVGAKNSNFKINAEYAAYRIALNELTPENERNDLEKFKGSTFQFFIPGSTSLTVDGLDKPIYKRVLFLNEDEIDKLRADLKNLVLDAMPDVLRGKLKNAYIQLLGSYLGDEKKAREKIQSKNITLADIMEFVTGFKSTNKLFSFRLDDLDNPQKVTGNDLVSMKREIARKVEGIARVRDDESLKLKTDWGTFFWLDESMLP